MNDYYFEKNDFIIKNYDQKKTFSSFLPALAGKHGIPLWAFYVNRGQGIASFGIRDKNGSIMEFFPANAAYIHTAHLGFRTFIKDENNKTYEIFSTENKNKREMHIKQAEFSIVEYNPELNIKVTITYFGLPNEKIASLVRMVKIENLSDVERHLEVLDGIAQILPAGTGYEAYKMVSHIRRSFMEVNELENNFAFYQMKGNGADEAEMQSVIDGNYYFSIYNDQLVKPICDSNLIFDYDTALTKPEYFNNHSLNEILKEPQITDNKVPCGFTAVKVVLTKEKPVNIDTLIGYASKIDILKKEMDKFLSHEYVEAKRNEATLVIDELLNDIDTSTNYPIFDEYVKQMYLDNILRGGYPLVINSENKNFCYHIYSRKHGDLERDYNYFTINPEFYSQGNGNFRDVCQNRRCDVFFNKDVYDNNIHVFASLIQADGYNPLQLSGLTFEIKDKSKVDELLNLFKNKKEVMEKLLLGKFTPGSIINTLENEEIEVTFDLTGEERDNKLFTEIFKYAESNIEANYAEGYWIDHWTYILDIFKNFYRIYPDKVYDCLFKRNDYRFFESCATVYPRDEKYVLSKNGKVRQFGAVNKNDLEKVNKLGLTRGSNWLKTADGNILETNLYGKFLVLAINKFALLDQEQMGIEMEADRPGWNDAMNGLPGIFASGVSETIELKRLIETLLVYSKENEFVKLPYEFVKFADRIESILGIKDHFEFWDKLSTVRENYRSDIRLGSKAAMEVKANRYDAMLREMLEIINDGIRRAIQLGNGIVPTYLSYEVTDYEKILVDGKEKITHYGLPAVKAKAFKVTLIPLFLEAPARYFTSCFDRDELKDMYKKVKSSELYDEALKMYKTSTPLDDWSTDIGRIRIFSKGWLERESNFMHMTYKYMLGLIKGGLYRDFYNEIMSNFSCFMDPSVYGRNPLENSSFIATSNNPDKSLHGQGFYARLSGSTSEVLIIWELMFMGHHPFILKDGKLSLKLKPLLSRHFFKNGKVSFMLLSHTKVTYINEDDLNLFEKGKAYKYVLDGKEILGESLPEQESLDVRNGKVKELVVYFK